MQKLSTIAKHWAIEPDSLKNMATEWQSFSFSDDLPMKNTRTVSLREGIAIIPVKGPITAEASLFSCLFGGTALDVFVKDFQKAVEDSHIKAILLDIDSPGGVAVGPCEVAEMIYQARSRKPIWAYIGRHGCSAAYWLAAAAQKIVANVSAMVGSIGVVTAISVQESPDSEGCRTIEIVSTNAANKRPDPRTADGMSEIRRELDSLETEFIEAIATYRNVLADTVRSDFGRGGVVVGRDAHRVHMVDELGTFEEVVKTLTVICNNLTSGELRMTTVNELLPQALNKEPVPMTASTIKDMFPAIYEMLKQEGFKEGREAERNRLLSIEAAALVGHEDLVNQAKMDPDMTGEKLALQIVKAEKAKGSDFLSTAKRAEAALPQVTPSIEPINNAPQISPNAPIETKAKITWDNDPHIRAEFAEYDTYLAFCKAEANGQVRIFEKEGRK